MIAGWTQAAMEPWVRAGRFLAEWTPGPEGPVALHTPNRVRWETPHARLRSFQPESVRSALPMLVVPPEINGSNLCDYGPDQSLVRALQRGGFGEVHALEWRTATEATRDFDIDESVAAILRAVDSLGGRVHLLGICQGGWQAAVVAALRPEAVETLTLAAAPIDFRSPAGPLGALVDATPMTTYESLVRLGGGVMRGELLRQGFTNLRFFERRVLEPLTLWRQLDDPVYLARRRRMGRWYRAQKDLPGRAYLRTVRELFKENRLIQGTFEVLGQRVDLGRIRCPLALVAGGSDHITLPGQLFALQRVAAPGRCRRWVLPAGHIGVVIKRGLPGWDGICGWLLDEPRPGAC